MSKVKSLIVQIVSRSAAASALVVWLALRTRGEHEQA